MDYGKWKYQQQKKEQKARTNSKQSEIKGIRLRPNIDDHDLMLKVNHARQFINQGHKVLFTMIFRGRQMAHRDLAMQKMRQVSDSLADISKVEVPARMLGRRMTMVIAPGLATKADGPPRPKPPAPPVPAAETAPPAPPVPAAPTAETAPPVPPAPAAAAEPTSE